VPVKAIAMADKVDDVITRKSNEHPATVAAAPVLPWLNFLARRWIETAVAP
jgi:hypothetical protein